MNKKAVITVVSVLLLVFLFSFNRIWTGTVKGSVNPGDGALRAFVFSAKDTFSANVINSTFIIPGVKPGSYNLLVQAKPPYQNVLKESVSVVDGEPTDVGMIELHK
jgi:hypothetical protein